jgi:hypothetical protein
MNDEFWRRPSDLDSIFKKVPSAVYVVDLIENHALGCGQIPESQSEGDECDQKGCHWVGLGEISYFTERI